MIDNLTHRTYQLWFRKGEMAALLAVRRGAERAFQPPTEAARAAAYAEGFERSAAWIRRASTGQELGRLS